MYICIHIMLIIIVITIMHLYVIISAARSSCLSPAGSTLIRTLPSLSLTSYWMLPHTRRGSARPTSNTTIFIIVSYDYNYIV